MEISCTFDRNGVSIIRSDAKFGTILSPSRCAPANGHEYALDRYAARLSRSTGGRLDFKMVHYPIDIDNGYG